MTVDGIASLIFQLIFGACCFGIGRLGGRLTEDQMVDRLCEIGLKKKIKNLCEMELKNEVSRRVTNRFARGSTPEYASEQEVIGSPYQRYTWPLNPTPTPLAQAPRNPSGLYGTGLQASDKPCDTND